MDITVHALARLARHPSCNRAGRRGCGSPVSERPWTRRNCSGTTLDTYRAEHSTLANSQIQTNTALEHTKHISYTPTPPFFNMTDLKTEFSLLVGSDSSKSYPGTQVSPLGDTQGPGCPPYSGVGKDPLSLMTNRQTPASPLDLTSLSEAIPEPTPAYASAWTLVAPKQKRKGKSNRNKNSFKNDGQINELPGQTDRQTEYKTDRQTDTLGNIGGKRKDSDCPTAGTSGVAGGSNGRSEEGPPMSGGHILADSKATPGCNAGDHAYGQVPGPYRNPNTSRESSTNTTRAGQTAVKDRVNLGGLTDPDGNPIRTRGATGPDSSNTARPQTTTTNPTNAHNLPKSRAHPRFRKRNRGRTHTHSAETATPGQSKKRDRLDDTISPRGENKRPRTDLRQNRDVAGSYALAAQSHLSVAVTTTPRLDLTPAEANAIQGQIQKAIFAACLKPPTPGKAAYAPAFDGKAFPSEGVLKMRCIDDQALSWLKTVVPSLISPRDNTRLTVIRQSDIPRKVRSALYVPDFDGEIGQLHQVLSLQNPWYCVSQWTLYSHQATTSSPPGIFLILGIPREELTTILARGRKVAYSTGTIYIRFFTTEGLSDVPPGQNLAPEDVDEPGVAGAMDVDQPTNCGDQNSKTPEPSVSTVLDNIEAVLTDTQETMLQSRGVVDGDSTAPNAQTALAERIPAPRAHKN